MRRFVIEEDYAQKGLNSTREPRDGEIRVPEAYWLHLDQYTARHYTRHSAKLFTSYPVVNCSHARYDANQKKLVRGLSQKSEKRVLIVSERMTNLRVELISRIARFTSHNSIRFVLSSTTDKQTMKCTVSRTNRIRAAPVKGKRDGVSIRSENFLRDLQI
jgi:hypothetical protein